MNIRLTIAEASCVTPLGVLPGRAKLVLARRVLPDESISTVETEAVDLLATVEREEGIDLSFEEIQRYEPAAVAADCDLAETVRRYTRDIYQPVEEPWGIEAATDIRNLVNDAEMQAITWEPGRLAQAHTRDESVSLDAAQMGQQILTETIRNLVSRSDTDPDSTAHMKHCNPPTRQGAKIQTYAPTFTGGVTA